MSVYLLINKGRQPGYSVTPLMRVYEGDLVRIKIEVAARSRTTSPRWTEAAGRGSGHGAAPNSGWRNAQSVGISEQFTSGATLVIPNINQRGKNYDDGWSIDSSQDGWWSGTWGLLGADRAKSGHTCTKSLPADRCRTLLPTSSSTARAQSATQGV